MVTYGLHANDDFLYVINGLRKLSSASWFWPRPRPRPRRLVFGLGLGLENLSSFNITGFHTSSSMKIWSPQRMLGNDVAVFVREFGATQFATVSSCAWRFFKHFKFKFWQNDTIYRRVVNSCFSWNLTCSSVTLWCTFPDSRSIQGMQWRQWIWTYLWSDSYDAILCVYDA